MRKIGKIILHCSDSSNLEHDSIEVIREWHIERGFDDVGYHFFIRSTGDIQQGRPIYERGAHCLHHNEDSIGICLHGKKEFNRSQFISLSILLQNLLEMGNLTVKDIYAHNFFDKKKTCPNFDVQLFIKKYLPIGEDV